MHNLHCVTIDAGVFAVPHVDCTKDEAFHYIDTLEAWRKLFCEPWIAIFMSERASESLFDDDLFPLPKHLEKLFNAHGITEYDANTFATFANRILTTTPYFESHYRINDVLWDRVETDPDVIRLTNHANLQSDLTRCIVLFAVLRKHCSEAVGGHSLILREAPKQVIRIRAHIHELEHAREDIPVLPAPPEFFEGDALVCDDFMGLVDCLDEAAILVGASDDQGIVLAVRIALFKNAIAQSASPNWSNVIVPTIGPKFRNLCQQICADQGASVPTKILRSIVETLQKQNLRAVHALRTGPGGNDPQKQRGTDKAQRRDIDRELHLHYWERADGTIELASVVYHDDFSIPR